MAIGGKRPGAGRPKGVPDKRTLAVKEKLDALGCDPITGMARIALTCEKEIAIINKAIEKSDDPIEKVSIIRTKDSAISQVTYIYKELAQYIAPKKKAVEHTGPENGPIQGEWKVTVIGD